MKIILLHSDVQGIGKTTLANLLKIKGIVDEVDSFAKPIKDISYDIYNTLTPNPISNLNFKQNYKDSLILNELSPRDFICSFSELIQKYYTEQVWIKYFLNKHRCRISEPYLLIVDDWRRYIESSYLEANNIECIKVYLSKHNANKQASELSSMYENNIKKEDCDIVFEFTEDHSNISDVIEIISNRLKG